MEGKQMSEKAQPIKPEEVKIEIINERHIVTGFTSYEQDLVDFLIEDALQNQKLRLSVTFLWFYRSQLVSYVTLLNDKINLEGDLKEFFQEKEICYASLPALKIGRLCVDDCFLKRGLGRQLVLFSIEKAKEIHRDKAGCRFVTVDAKGNSADFYKKLGFKTFPRQTGRGTIFMHFDLLKSPLL